MDGAVDHHPSPPPAILALTPATSWECLRLPGFQFPIGDLASSTLQLQIVVVYFLTQALHRCVFKHFGLPQLVSQIIAGVILSPNAFYIEKGGLYEHIDRVIFPEPSSNVWRTIAWFGCAFSSLIYAVKIDYGLMVRNGQKAYFLGGLGLLIPLGVNALLTLRFTGFHGTKFSSTLSTTTHFPSVACLLSHLDLLNSELGRLALGISLITGMSSLLLFTVGNNIRNIDWNYFEHLCGPLGTTIVALFVLRPIMKMMIQHTPKDRPIKNVFVLSLLLFGFVAGLVTHYTSHSSVLLGIFIVGAVTPDGPPLASAFIDIFDAVINGVLLPFFITGSVMRANLFTIDFSDVITWKVLAYSIFPSVIKLLLGLACAMYTDMSLADGAAIGFLMSARGFIDISEYVVAVESDSISSSVYTVMVFWAMVVAIVIPLAVRSLYNPSTKYAGYQKRDITHLRHSSELKIVACIYKTEHAIAITNLLDVLNPTRRNPIVAYILHIVKLRGRSLPTFISHGVQQKKSTTHRSHSEDIVLAFDRYQRSHTSRYHGGLATHVFTSVTLLKEMHEDICTLALSNVTSLIVLPFHRKLGIDGAIDSENSDQRSLNLSILDRAPCSVAVHVHRGRGHRGGSGSSGGSFNKESFNYNFSQSASVTSNATAIYPEVMESDSEPEFVVAVVFIGGNDDREAVALAKWITRGVRVRVHLIRLISAAGGEDEGDVDSMLIQDIRTSNEYREKFSYQEVTVMDGGETVSTVKGMADDYDLTIVGRRYGQECHQTAGLSEWSEVPELGVIGDLLASPDLQRRTSVLVVQRQKQRVQGQNRYL